MGAGERRGAWEAKETAWGCRMGLQKATFMPILEPKIAAFKPTIQVIQVSLVARGLVSARGHPRGHPGWCGAAVGGVGWLPTRGRRTGQISEIAPPLKSPKCFEN